jgi:choline dehydrogenase-like flavoprotein
MSEHRKTQVLIIGSGAGGATTALTLAEAGFQVTVLEEGKRHSLNDYGKSATEAMPLLYRNRGMTPILGRVPIGYVEGRCLGGSTEINSGFWQRLAPQLALKWQDTWQIDNFSSELLEPHYQWAESLLHVSQRPDHWPKSTLVLKQGADAQGFSAAEIARAADQCVNTNRCASGCPKKAKQGMSFNLIPLAESAGAQFITDCRVRHLIKKNKRIIAVMAELVRDGQSTPLRIDADYVFVCAGPSQTPALLRRSGIKSNVGNNFQIHPMLKVAALYDQEMDAEKSVLPLIQVKEFWPDITLGGSYFSAGHLAMILSDNWPANQVYMRDHRRMANYYVSVRGTGRGSVRAALGEQGASLRYDLSAEDLGNLSRGFARLSSLLLASGAKRIFPSMQGSFTIESEKSANRWLDELLPGSALSLTTVHAFSACPIGERKDRCAANSFGKIFKFENLYINDASMLPDSPATNPQGAIMAIARRNALHFKESNSRSP